MRKQLMILAIAAIVFTTVQAFGATQATGVATISPTLVVNVTVQKAVRLTLATGTTCAVTAGSDYAMNLGNVDALAIEAPACGNNYPPTTPGTTDAVYYSDYTLTPIFTSQSPDAGPTITAYVSTPFTLTNLSVVQANSAPASISSLTAMSTSSATPTSVATAVVSGTSLTRYIGVSVAPANGASLTGASTATITYTLTVL